MARAEAQWEDPTGTSRVALAMLEDISRGGAGIRLRQPISVGSKLKIKWHKEQFSAQSAIAIAREWSMFWAFSGILRAE